MAISKEYKEYDILYAEDLNNIVNELNNIDNEFQQVKEDATIAVTKVNTLDVVIEGETEDLSN